MTGHYMPVTFFSYIVSHRAYRAFLRYVFIDTPCLGIPYRYVRLCSATNHIEQVLTETENKRPSISMSHHNRAVFHCEALRLETS